MSRPSPEPRAELTDRLALRPTEVARALGLSERAIRQILPQLPHHQSGRLATCRQSLPSLPLNEGGVGHPWVHSKATIGLAGESWRQTGLVADGREETARRSDALPSLSAKPSHPWRFSHHLSHTVGGHVVCSAKDSTPGPKDETSRAVKRGTAPAENHGKGIDDGGLPARCDERG